MSTIFVGGNNVIPTQEVENAVGSLLERFGKKIDRYHVRAENRHRKYCEISLLQGYFVTLHDELDKLSA